MFTDSLRFLVIEGYDRSARQQLVENGMSPANELYINMMMSLAPNAKIDVIAPADPGASLPPGVELNSYDGAAMTGSSLSVLDSDNPAVRSQIDLLNEVFECGVPATGSCWALQVGAVAAGGVVAENPKGREMGFARKVTLTEEGRRHPLYDGKSAVFDAIASHEDEIVEPPSESTVLASNAYSEIQSIEIRHRNGVMWTFQYHPEYNMHELAALIRCRASRLIKMGFFEDEEALADYTNKLDIVHNDAGRKDVKWALGIDSDVLDASTRHRELHNWIKHLVLPRAHAA